VEHIVTNAEASIWTSFSVFPTTAVPTLLPMVAQTLLTNTPTLSTSLMGPTVDPMGTSTTCPTASPMADHMTSPTAATTETPTANTMALLQQYLQLHQQMVQCCQ